MRPFSSRGAAGCVRLRVGAALPARCVARQCARYSAAVSRCAVPGNSGAGARRGAVPCLPLGCPRRRPVARLAARAAEDSAQPAAGSTPGPDDEAHWAGVRAELEGTTKLELQDKLRALNLKMTGRKDALIDSLVAFYKAAAAAGLSPEELRRRQAEEPDSLPQELTAEQLTRASEPEEPGADVRKWTVEQLRAGLRRRGLSARGNKADMVARLTAAIEGGVASLEPENAGLKPAPRGRPPLAAAEAPWEADRRDAEEMPAAPPGVDASLLEARTRKQAELNQLTVNEIVNLMKARRLPIGTRKRKADLVERLLDTIFPTTLQSRAEISAAMASNAAFSKWMEAEQRERDALQLARSETLAALRAFLPAFDPAQECVRRGEWPLVAIRRELLEAGLSATGSRAELLQLLQSRTVTLEAQLEGLEDDELEELRHRFGVFGAASDRPQACAALAQAIRAFSWFAPETSVYDTPLIPERAPPGERQEGSLTVALLAALEPGLQGQLALEAAQTVLQHLATANPGGEAGVRVPLYFTEGDAAWQCEARHLTAATELDLRAALHLHGRRLGSTEALLAELKGADAVLPLVADGERGLLRTLEQAGVEFVGSAFEAGELAANKHRCRERLEALGFPTVPQLHLTAADLDETTPGWQEALEARVNAWVDVHELDEDRTGLIVKPAAGSSARGVQVSGDGLQGALDAAAELLAEGAEGVVVEPLLRHVAEFSVLVVDTPAGPRASLPLEIELRDAREDFIDAELEMRRYFAKLAGATDEDIDEELPLAREAAMLAQADMLLYDSEKKHGATGNVQIHAPVRLPVELTLAIRDAAVKAFKELGLRDYARIDGFVQLPPPPPAARERPPELADYRVPSVEESAALLHHSDNISSGLAPPWDPPAEEPDLEALFRPLLEDGGWDNMGPYTDPALAEQYHSNDVELRVVQETGGVLGDEVEAVPLVQHHSPEELSEILAEGAELRDPAWVPDDRMGLQWSDEVPGWDAAARRWVQPEEQPSEEELGAEAMHADVSPPDLDATPAAELCRWEAGTVLITDVNVSPSLERAALVWQAALQSGVSQAGLLRHLASQAAGRQGLPPLPPPPAPPLAGTFLELPELAPPADSWDNYPPVTERDMRLPWFHTRFKKPIFEEDALEGAGDAELEGPLAKQLQGEDGGDPLAGSSSDSEGEEAAEPAEPQRVWVLCGGEGPDGPASLASGLHVFAELSKQADLQVELFVLGVPCGSGSQARRRRQGLLAKHVERVRVTSNPDVQQPPEQQLEHIRNPPQPEVELLMREVWAVPQHLALRGAVAEVQEACEAALAEASTVERLQQPWQREAHRLRSFVRDQLRAGGLAAAGGAWGAEAEPPCPRLLDAYEFAVRAGVADALVFPVLRGGVADGRLQGLLESLGVPFVGSPAAAAAACADKARTAEAVADLDMQVIETLPQLSLPLERLLKAAAAEEPEDALEQLLFGMQEHLGLQGEGVCLKPASSSSGGGAVRCECAADLAILAEALRRREPALPELCLSWGNPRLPLPARTPEQLLAEPFFAQGADNLVAEWAGETGQAGLRWGRRERWLPVSVGVIGPPGRMRALTPAVYACAPPRQLRTSQLALLELSEAEADARAEAGGGAGETALVARQAEDGSWEQAEVPVETEVSTVTQAGGRVRLCPPPPALVPPLALASAQERAEIVADRLRLGGLACLRGFLNAESGSLIVTSVDCGPALHAGSGFLAQALAQDPGTAPGQLLRELARSALQGPAVDSAEAEEAPQLAGADAFPPLMPTTPDGGLRLAAGSPA